MSSVKGQRVAVGRCHTEADSPGELDAGVTVGLSVQSSPLEKTVGSSTGVKVK